MSSARFKERVTNKTNNTAPPTILKTNQPNRQTIERLFATKKIQYTSVLPAQYFQYKSMTINSLFVLLLLLLYYAFLQFISICLLIRLVIICSFRRDLGLCGERRSSKNEWKCAKKKKKNGLFHSMRKQTK